MTPEELSQEQSLQKEAEELYPVQVIRSMVTQEQAAIREREAYTTAARKYREIIYKLGERVREAESMNQELEQKAMEQAAELAGVDARVAKMFTADQVRQMLGEAFDRGVAYGIEDERSTGYTYKMKSPDKQTTINSLIGNNGK